MVQTEYQMLKCQISFVHHGCFYTGTENLMGPNINFIHTEETHISESHLQNMLFSV